MHRFLGFLLFLAIAVSCNPDRMYDQYQSIENHEWAFENKVEFIVSNQDTISNKNVFINIRNNKDYEFSSLFLIAKINFPDGLTIVDTLEYEMTDSQGKWLGAGYTDIKENKLFYKENVIFDQTGDYIFQLQQATRSIDDIEGNRPLKGITDVGLSIEKVTK